MLFETLLLTECMAVTCFSIQYDDTGPLRRARQMHALASTFIYIVEDEQIVRWVMRPATDSFWRTKTHRQTFEMIEAIRL